MALALFVAPGSLFSQSSKTFLRQFSLFGKDVRLLTDSLTIRYSLRDSLIIPGSERTFLDGAQLVRDVDYDFNYGEAWIRLKRPPPDSSVLHITYERFPFRLRRRYRHREVVSEPSAPEISEALHPTPTAVSRSAQEAKEFAATNLRKSGSVVRGLSIGSNQGLQVDSGLRLQVSGKLAENIEVVAALTDQNTPIQPEGNTQSLNEIDKVYVQVKGPHLQTTLGDYTLNLKGGELTNYSRKLEGIMASAHFDNRSVTLSAAVSRGQFHTMEFIGREGNQGPYQLQGPSGRKNIIVLAGTERIWVDGEPMIRGDRNDYVIEYANGEITFSRHRLITSDSRIVVDFQFSDESFKRSYWALQGESKLINNKVTVGTTFIRESDDKNNPLSLALTEEGLDSLDAAGDSQAVVPGWQLVGPNSGNYALDEAGFFVFVGENAGNYQVRFSFFGPGKGNYRNISLGRYEHVGPNLGDYAPYVILSKAQSHDFAGFSVDLAPTDYLSVNSQFALSRVDDNLYSSRDDSDNSGSAYDIKLRLKSDAIKLGDTRLGQFQLNARLRNRSTDFADIDRATVPEFNRRWDIVSGSRSRHENIRELEGIYGPIPGLSLRSGFGFLSKSSQFKSKRWEGQTILNRRGLPKGDYFIEIIDREDRDLMSGSDWVRQRGRLEHNFLWLIPAFEYEGEIRKESRDDSLDFGFRFDSFTYGIRAEPWRSMQASASFNLRKDQDRIEGAFLPKSRATTQSYSWSLRRWHSVSSTVSYTHRERTFEDVSSRPTRTDLADWRLVFSPRDRGIRSNLYYQISNTQVAIQEEIYIEVAEGEGNFRFNEELGEYEPDVFGDFVRRLVATEDFRPVIALRMRADIRLNPGRFFSSGRAEPQSEQPSFLRRAADALSGQTFLRIDERTTQEDVAKIYLLKLDYFQQDSTTIFGSIDFRQDIYLWEKSREFSLRYRFRDRRVLNNQLLNAGDERLVKEHRLRALYRLSSRFTNQVEFFYEAEDRLFKTPGRANRRVRTNGLEVDLVYRPRSQLELGLKNKISVNKDLASLPETRANLISFTPRMSYNVNKKGRVRAELEWTRVTVSPENQVIPYELTRGKRAGSGLRWSFALDYRVSQNVRASMSYIGRSEPDRPQTQHIAKVEMRAFF